MFLFNQDSFHFPDFKTRPGLLSASAVKIPSAGSNTQITTEHCSHLHGTVAGRTPFGDTKVVHRISGPN